MVARKLTLWVLHAMVLAAASLDASGATLAPAQEIAEQVQAGQHEGIESFIMKVNGETVGRAVSSELDKRPPDLRSATKSITALLVGIAIDQGKIASVQEKVADILPVVRNIFADDARKSAMTLEDLLTMRSGLDCNDWNPDSPGQEDKMYKQKDWVRFWAELPMRKNPGEEFAYCTGNAIAIGEILANATGISPDAFALTTLFIPLQMDRAEWEYWDRKEGVDTGGHLRLKPDDFVKLGELVLAGGTYKGKRVVSEAWINAMTQERTTIPRVQQRYGYFWWLDHTKDPKLPQTRLWWAQGNGGTLLMVMPEVRSVIAITGTRFNQTNGLEPMFWLRDRLLPAMLTPN